MDNDPQSHPTPEKVTLDDNARKFTCETLEPQFLDQNGASSFTLIIDWLETDEDNEKKLAYKKFDDGHVEIFLVAKVTKDGKRTAEKQPISEDRYKELENSSILHLEKKRYELTYVQNDISYDLKYDDFGEGKLKVLEVDASDENVRDTFDPSTFPGGLFEVTGDMRYYGYRMAAMA